MLKCSACGFVVKCCMLDCPKCQSVGTLFVIEEQAHYWDWDGNVLVCQKTAHRSSMPADIMEELTYCPFCMEELAPQKHIEAPATCEGDRPPKARGFGQMELPVLK